MFDVGFWELVLIFGLGLMILGPERLPRVANKVGRWVGKARRTAGELRRQLERELDFDDLAGKKTYTRPAPAASVTPEPPITDHMPVDDDDEELGHEPEAVAAEADASGDPAGREEMAAAAPEISEAKDSGELPEAPESDSVATSSAK